MGARAMGKGKTRPTLTVSVVIAAYNDEAYVGRAIESCLRQSHPDVQVIVVDDGSSDETALIARRFAAKHPGIEIISLERNVGTHDARAEGLAKARGALVTFLDADDELTRDACACISSEYLKDPVDILHFGMRIDDDGTSAEGHKQRLESWTRPLAERLGSEQILTRSFVDLDYAFNLAGKAYPTALAKKAFQRIGSLRCDFGEDALEYFAIAYFAQSYRGLPTRRLYTYHLGDGLSAQAKMTQADFARPLRGHEALCAIEAFLDREGDAEDLRTVFEAHRDNQLDALMKTWYERVTDEDAAACLAAAFELWPAELIVMAVCKQGGDAVERMRTCLGLEMTLTEQQSYAAGYADGARAVRREYEESGSYKLGRAMSAVPRKLLGRA